MSIPSVIFIDTSIFDRQAYNFGSLAIEAFVKATTDLKITLLLPDPTEREIRRNIEELWRGATKAGTRVQFPLALSASLLRPDRKCQGCLRHYPQRPGNGLGVQTHP